MVRMADETVMTTYRHPKRLLALMQRNEKTAAKTGMKDRRKTSAPTWFTYNLPMIPRACLSNRYVRIASEKNLAKWYIENRISLGFDTLSWKVKNFLPIH